MAEQWDNHTPVAASLSLAAIMVPAAVIHYRHTEYKNSWANLLLLFICVFIAWGRWY